MKWLSIKKYHPPTSTDLLVRAEHKDEYERYFVASAELLDGLESLIYWEMSNGAHHDLNLEDYKVTHFCVPSPVKIELS